MQDFHIWEGIYDVFPEEDADKVFESKQWIDGVAKEAEIAVRQLQADDPISETSTVHEYPLPLLCAIAAADHSGPFRVLDFGGGMAATYTALAGALPGSEDLAFHIVESEGVCERGREVFRDFSNLYFHETLPDPETQSFEVVHAGSSLQYVKDWQGIIARFAEYQPTYLAFSNALAGAIPTFVTRQQYYGRTIPVRFLNLDVMLEAVEAVGYRLIYQALQNRVIFGKPQELPTSNLPPEYRLKHGCNLIFRRCEGA